VGKNQQRRAAAREAKRAAARAGIAQQFGKGNVKEPSQPTPLGRSMFLSRADAKRFFSSAGAKQRGLVQSDPSTWNPKKESK
jgi:hypothetical protein